MAIPKFTLSGVLPPYLGNPVTGDQSPYETKSFEVVQTFGSSKVRCEILEGWLDHRAELQKLGFVSGFQWLDGSFVEDKTPRDIDIVVFHENKSAQRPTVINNNLNVFDPISSKTTFKVDPYFVDYSIPGEPLIEQSSYWLNLFSHRRNDDLWKGMLKVQTNTPNDDLAARKMLASLGATYV